MILVTGEQLRFASEDELLAAHSIPEEIIHPAAARGARNYTDLRGHTAIPAIQDDPQGEDPSPLQFSPGEPAGNPSSASRPGIMGVFLNMKQYKNHK